MSRVPSLCWFEDRNAVGLDNTTKCSSIPSPADFFCYGCGQVVCANHDVAGARVTHRHTVGSHLDREAFSAHQLYAPIETV